MFSATFSSSLQQYLFTATSRSERSHIRHINDISTKAKRLVSQFLRGNAAKLNL
jgi:hypothetical protein